jgi:lipopolysaccharide/colanic/teichoic acid biosynthesis glycosyltransferase
MKNRGLYSGFVKRVFDILFSIVALILLSPIFLVIAQIIKLSGKGPVIFKQKRVGKNGKVFILYKFRTMVPNAQNLKKKYQHLNEADGPVFKIKNDPRFINGIGKFLAKSGLDELPNIINVLKGDISWVGPRPLPVYEAKKINKKIRKIRESVKPGITSLWITKGAHNLKFKKWMELDLQYIKKINFGLDLKILFLTVKMVVKSIFNKLLIF